MSEIPIQPVWIVFGRNTQGHYKVMEEYPLSTEAEARADELRRERPELAVEVIESESIEPDRILPTNEQQKALGQVMHRAFVAIRNLAYSNESEPIAELADVFHNLPAEMFDERNWDWNSLERSLQRFQEKFPKASPYDFAKMIDEIRSMGGR
ncbi:MAG: hypothetical protein AAF591_19215 [Verrucomicrobiota bacterium]